MSGETLERLNVQTPAVALTAWLQEMVKAMVSKPDEVFVFISLQQKCVAIDIEVAAEDEGRLIGRKGQTARSLRTILEAVTAQTGTTYLLNLPHSSKEARE